MYSFRSNIFGSLLLSLFLLIACNKEVRPLQLAPLFTDHMVLQQQSKVAVWGTGEPGAQIKIISSWGEEVKTKVSARGNWEVEIPTTEFGGPHQLSIQGGQQEIALEDIMLGEVWLASGQSNMEWPLSARVVNREEEIKNADYPQIRMFSVPRNLNGTNINDAEWKVTTPKNVEQFSAVGYFFARELHLKLGLPVGIINTSWGGTRVEAWTSLEKLAEMPPSKTEAEEILNQGGLSALKENYKQISQALTKANEKYFNAPSHPVPQNINELKALELNDQAYALPEFDDTDWKEFLASGASNEIIRFEDFFKPGTYAGDGVAWLRKTFDVKDPTAEYSFIVEGGIDDFDYTYINGTLIGSEFGCCTTRSYIIPKGLLMEKGNVLAIRVIDTGGESGFRGAAYVQSNTEKQQLDKGSWRLKHHAFFSITQYKSTAWTIKL